MSLKNPDGVVLVTTDWLELIGFQFDDGGGNTEESYYWINGGMKSVFDLQYRPYCTDDDEKWALVNESGESFVDDPCTRDGVRELCEVLNIPLKTIGITS